MYRLLGILILIFVSCSFQETEFDLLNKKNPNGFYGNKISLTEYASFKNLMSYPDKYIGKDILLSGEILEVCPMRGCWIIVEDYNKESQIRIKVIDIPKLFTF